MKLVKALGDEFHFPFSGSISFDITKEGIVLPDEVANSMVNRFHVSIEEVDSPVQPDEDITSAPTALTNLDIEALRGLAKIHNIDLGRAKTKASLIKVIQMALEANPPVTEETAPIVPEVVAPVDPVIPATVEDAPVAPITTEDNQ